MNFRNMTWREDAACRDQDTAIFFPNNEAGATLAAEICATCPVREQCLEFALQTRQVDGVWGGLTEPERRRVRRRRMAAARSELEKDKAIEAA